MKKVTVMRFELLLVALSVLLGMSAWFAADRIATKVLKPCEPSEEAERIKRDVPWKQVGLDMTQKEQKATEEQLVEARLEYYKQSATLASLPTPSPTPTPAPARRAACGRAVADAGALPSPQEAQAVSQKREEALTQRDAAALQHDALIGRLGLLQNSANELRRGVEESSRAASVEYNWQRVYYRITKAVLTLAGTLGLLLTAYFLLLLIYLLFVKSARSAGHEPNTWLVLQMTIGLLVVLIAYQTFEMAGAAFFGSLVLLFFLWRMPWEKPKDEAEADGEQ